MKYSKTYVINNSVFYYIQLFGYLNMLVWGAGIWFLFKETRWHKELMPGAGGSERFDEPHAEAGASSYQQPDTSTTEPTPNTTGY